MRDDFAFQFLPVTSFEDCTSNFEQLQAIDNEEEAAASAWTALSYGPKLEATAGFQTPGWRSEESGATLRLRGVIQVKAGETLSAKETIFTLPEGARPPGKTDLLCYAEAPGFTNALLSIATTGIAVVVAWLGATEAGAGKVLILDSLTFNLT